MSESDISTGWCIFTNEEKMKNKGMFHADVIKKLGTLKQLNSVKFSVHVNQTKKAFLTFEGHSQVLLSHLNSCGKNHPQLVFFVT